MSRNENSISGWLGYKPVSIDNVFWDIINEQPNKKMPLSFRAEAAFCVREVNCFDYEFNIENVENPELEIRTSMSDPPNTFLLYIIYRFFNNSRLI